MFKGTYYHNLDAKNRVTVPRKHIEQASPGGKSITFNICLGMDNCLFLFTPYKWGEVAKLLNEALIFGKDDSRDFQRLFFSLTHEVDVDGSGRILIPEDLKTSAGLNREVVFLGVGNRVEIWDKEQWNGRKAKILPFYNNMAAGFMCSVKTLEENRVQ